MAFISEQPSNLAIFGDSIDGTATYGYDAGGQLTGASYTGAEASESYGYDQAGNRTSVDGNATTVGPFNQVTNDGTYSYQYNADGDMTEQTTLATGAYEVFAYDVGNELTSATLYTGAGVETEQILYTYDVFNNLIGRQDTLYSDGAASSTTNERLVYDDPADNGQAVAQFTTDSAAAPTAANLSDIYLWGPAVDQLLADEQVTNPDAPGNILWTLDDSQNTVRDTVSSAGVIEDHITYNAFGQPLSHTALNPAAVDAAFGYDGLFTDPTTGEDFAVNRVYNPSSGTWNTPDPAQADVNTYRAFGNSPTNEVDPSGLNAVMEVKLHEDRALYNRINAAVAQLAAMAEGNSASPEELFEKYDEIVKMHKQFVGQRIATNAYEAYLSDWAILPSFSESDLKQQNAALPMRMQFELSESEMKELQASANSLRESSTALAARADITEQTLRYAGNVADGITLATGVGGVAKQLVQTAAREGLKAAVTCLAKKAVAVGVGTAVNWAGASIAKKLGASDQQIQIGMRVFDLLTIARAMKVKCFPAGTLVASEAGLKPIEHVVAGQRVWAFDIRAGEWELREVLRTVRSEHAGLMARLRVAGEEIRATTTHPFWVVGGESLENRPYTLRLNPGEPEPQGPSRWVDAGDLRVGDMLLLQGGEIAPITEIELLFETLEVYNLHVDELHNYAVGNHRVLAHNGGPEDCLPASSNATNAQSRANEIHQALDPRAQNMRTTAVTETAEGIRIVSSSTNRLTPAQRAKLRPGEIEGAGPGHAEVTGVEAAKASALTPTGTAASRPICPECTDYLNHEGVAPLSPLKEPNQG